jgi:hypothetical protein
MNALNGAVVPYLVFRHFTTVRSIFSVVEPPAFANTHVNLLIASLKHYTRGALQHDVVAMPVVSMRWCIGMLKHATARLNTVDHHPPKTRTANVMHQVHDQNAGLGKTTIDLLIHTFVLIVAWGFQQIVSLLLRFKNRARRETKDDAIDFTKRALGVGTKIGIFMPPRWIAGDLCQERHHIKIGSNAQKVLHRGTKFTVGAAEYVIVTTSPARTGMFPVATGIEPPRLSVTPETVPPLTHNVPPVAAV